MPEKDLSVELGADAADFEVPPHRPEGMERFEKRHAVSEMLADERAKSRKAIHAWDEARRAELRTANDLPIPTDKRNKRSGFDRRLPYKGVMVNGAILYSVQNRKIFKGMALQIQLKDVPEEIAIPEKRYPKGEVLPAGVVYARKEISRYLAIGDAEIIDSDPLRCKVCIDYGARSELDLMAHYLKKHPKEAQELADGLEKIRAEEDAAMQRPLPEIPRAPQPQRQTFR